MRHARRLRDLPPGTRFCVAQMPALTGVLERANDCTAYVRYDLPPALVRIGERAFVAERSKQVGVTPSLAVIPE